MMPETGGQGQSIHFKNRYSVWKIIKKRESLQYRRFVSIRGSYVSRHLGDIRDADIEASMRISCIISPKIASEDIDLDA